MLDNQPWVWLYRNSMIHWHPCWLRKIRLKLWCESLFLKTLYFIPLQFVSSTRVLLDCLKTLLGQYCKSQGTHNSNLCATLNWLSAKNNTSPLYLKNVLLFSAIWDRNWQMVTGLLLPWSWQWLSTCWNWTKCDWDSVGSQCSHSRAWSSRSN